MLTVTTVLFCRMGVIFCPLIHKSKNEPILYLASPGASNGPWRRRLGLSAGYQEGLLFPSSLSLTLNCLNKRWMDYKNVFNLVKFPSHYSKATTKIIPNSQVLKSFPLKRVSVQVYTLSLLPFDTAVDVQASAIRK